MAFRDFDTSQLSRRALLRGGAWLSAGSALAAMPMGNAVLARTPAKPQWPHVAEMINGYVNSGKLANMVATIGWGRARPRKWRAAR